MAGSLQRLGRMLRGGKVSGPVAPAAEASTRALTSSPQVGRAGGMMSAVRSAILGSGGRNFLNVPYELASMHESIPRASVVGPVNIASYQPVMSALARYYYRNDAWIKRIVDKQADTVVGTGPVPTSPFEELNHLFMLWWEFADSRGTKRGGDWLREDVFKPRMIDGEVLVRKIVQERNGITATGQRIPYDDMIPPLQYQALTSDYLPVSYSMVMPGSEVITGIEFDSDPKRLDQRLAYWLYPNFPGDFPRLGALTNGLLPIRVPANEIMHYFSSAMPGSSRGEVMLAAALMRAIKLSFLEDSEITRMSVASRFAGFLKQTAQAMGEAQFRKDQGNLIRQLQDILSMDPGTFSILPPGVDLQFTAPPNFIPNSVENLIFSISYICACVGIPVHQVTQNYNEVQSDRVIKFSTLDHKQVVDRDQSGLEGTIMNPIWRDFVDWCVLLDLWKPKRGKADILRAHSEVSWQWPLIMTSQLTQELDIMMKSVAANIIDEDSVSRMYFGRSNVEVLRRRAIANANSQALGFLPGPPSATGATQILWQPQNNPLALGLLKQAIERETANAASTN